MSRSKVKYTGYNTYLRHHIEMSFVGYRESGPFDEYGTDFRISTEIQANSLEKVVSNFQYEAGRFDGMPHKIRPIYVYVTKRWGVSSFEGPHHTQLKSERFVDVSKADRSFASFQYEDAFSEIRRILTECGYLTGERFDMDAILKDELDDGVRTEVNRRGSFYPKGYFSKGVSIERL